MSTRGQIAFHDGEDKHHGALLYHHSDCYASSMLPKLVRFLKKTDDALHAVGYPYWWDSERVAAYFVLFSAYQYDEPGVVPEANIFAKVEWSSSNYQEREKLGSRYPMFQPSVAYHGDIEYLYRVHLFEKQDPKEKEDDNRTPKQINTWRIDIFKVGYSGKDYEKTRFTKIGSVSSEEEAEKFLKEQEAKEE